MNKITLPAQDVPVDLNSQVDPLWYEKLQMLAAKSNLFEEKFAVLQSFIDHGAYSEATYAPVLTASGGTIPTFVAVPLFGRYFKLGRLVTVRVAASNTAGGTPGAGAQQLSVSLPLPVAASALASRITCGSFSNGGVAGLALAEGAAGATSLTLWQQAVSGSKVVQAALTNVDFNNVNRVIAFAFTYPTD